MDVYQVKDGKVFGIDTQLDIFNDDPRFAPDRLIAPFTNQTFEFGVRNTMTDMSLPYTLSIKGTNLADLPIVASLTRNGTYVLGGPSAAQMVPLSEISFDEQNLAANATDLFVLNYQWRTVTDELDTALGDDGTQTYSVLISARGTIDEPITVTPPGPSNPKTGDMLDLRFVGALMLGTFIMIVVLGLRGKDRDDHETS
jgi:hypothetical protein